MLRRSAFVGLARPLTLAHQSINERMDWLSTQIPLGSSLHCTKTSNDSSFENEIPSFLHVLDGRRLLSSQHHDQPGQHLSALQHTIGHGLHSFAHYIWFDFTALRTVLVGFHSPLTACLGGDFSTTLKQARTRDTAKLYWAPDWRQPCFSCSRYMWLLHWCCLLFSDGMWEVWMGMK